MVYPCSRADSITFFVIPPSPGKMGLTSVCICHSTGVWGRRSVYGIRWRGACLAGPVPQRQRRQAVHHLRPHKNRPGRRFHQDLPAPHQPIPPRLPQTHRHPPAGVFEPMIPVPIPSAPSRRGLLVSQKMTVSHFPCPESGIQNTWMQNQKYSKSCKYPITMS